MTKNILFSLALISALASPTICFSDNKKEIESVTVEGDLRHVAFVAIRYSSVKLTQVRKGDKVVVTGKAAAIFTLSKLINLVKSGKPGTVEALPSKARRKNGKVIERQWTSLGSRKDSAHLFKALRNFGARNRQTELLHLVGDDILLIHGPENEVAAYQRVVEACEKYHKAMTEKKK